MTIPIDEPTDMTGKVCMITGSTAGIGKVTALELAKMGATVIIVARSRQRGRPALRFVQEGSGSDSIELMYADLSSIASIQKLVENFRKKRSRLDVLINNAAVVPKERELSLDGYEMQFAVNHLAPFCLTNLMLDILKATEGARIINVSSEAHNRAKLDFDNLQSEKKYSPFSAYGMSKLANIYFTYALARRLEGTTVTANALHPGVIRSELIRQMPIWYEWVFNWFAKPTDDGSEGPVFLASSQQVIGVSGKYFSGKLETKSSPASYDEVAGERLWELSERLCEIESLNGTSYKTLTP